MHWIFSSTCSYALLVCSVYSNPMCYLCLRSLFSRECFPYFILLSQIFKCFGFWDFPKRYALIVIRQLLVQLCFYFFYYFLVAIFLFLLLKYWVSSSQINIQHIHLVSNDDRWIIIPLSHYTLMAIYAHSISYSHNTHWFLSHDGFVLI